MFQKTNVEKKKNKQLREFCFSIHGLYKPVCIVLVTTNSEKNVITQKEQNMVEMVPAQDPKNTSIKNNKGHQNLPIGLRHADFSKETAGCRNEIQNLLDHLTQLSAGFIIIQDTHLKEKAN